jgi:hypothetical protein
MARDKGYLTNNKLIWTGDTMTAETPQTLSVPEAGKTYLGLTRNSSYAAAARGDIPTIKIGRLLRVPVRAMERMLDTVSEGMPRRANNPS